jgi:hypothetical protein
MLNHTCRAVDADIYLRTELNQIALQPVERHEALVEELHQRCPHSITVVERAGSYTCFQHAFSLVEPPAVVRTIGIVHTDVFPSPDFVEYLVKNVLVAVHRDESGIGDLVLYRDGLEARHAGVLHGRGIRSKWGIGHLWDHALFEVPATYGTTIEYFRSISQATAVTAFLRYARHRLGSVTFDQVVGRRRRPGEGSE